MVYFTLKLQRTGNLTSENGHMPILLQKSPYWVRHFMHFRVDEKFEKMSIRASVEIDRFLQKTFVYTLSSGTTHTTMVTQTLTYLHTPIYILTHSHTPTVKHTQLEKDNPHAHTHTPTGLQTHTCHTLMLRCRTFESQNRSKLWHIFKTNTFKT